MSDSNILELLFSSQETSLATTGKNAGLDRVETSYLKAMWQQSLKIFIRLGILYSPSGRL